MTYRYIHTDIQTDGTSIFYYTKTSDTFTVKNPVQAIFPNKYTLKLKIKFGCDKMLKRTYLDAAPFSLSFDYFEHVSIDRPRVYDFFCLMAG